MTEQIRNELDEKQMSRRLSMIMEMGEILLISGAEVSRVEDTITRLCRAYGFARADVFHDNVEHRRHGLRAGRRSIHADAPHTRARHRPKQGREDKRPLAPDMRRAARTF